MVHCVFWQLPVRTSNDFFSYCMWTTVACLLAPTTKANIPYLYESMCLGCYQPHQQFTLSVIIHHIWLILATGDRKYPAGTVVLDVLYPCCLTVTIWPESNLLKSSYPHIHFWKNLFICCHANSVRAIT